jgi:hypothetical protein
MSPGMQVYSFTATAGNVFQDIYTVPAGISYQVAHVQVALTFKITLAAGLSFPRADIYLYPASGGTVSLMTAQTSGGTSTTQGSYKSYSMILAPGDKFTLSTSNFTAAAISIEATIFVSGYDVP